MELVIGGVAVAECTAIGEVIVSNKLIAGDEFYVDVDPAMAADLGDIPRRFTLTAGGDSYVFNAQAISSEPLSTGRISVCLKVLPPTP
jgi:hypothetical protein